MSVAVVLMASTAASADACEKTSHRLTAVRYSGNAPSDQSPDALCAAAFREGWGFSPGLPDVLFRAEDLRDRAGGGG